MTFLHDKFGVRTEIGDWAAAATSHHGVAHIRVGKIVKITENRMTLAYYNAVSDRIIKEVVGNQSWRFVKIARPSAELEFDDEYR